jgi:hypothetical protein
VTTPEDTTEDTTECPPWLNDETWRVLSAAMAGDTAQVLDRVQRIRVEGGDVALFSACGLWATAIGEFSGLSAKLKQAPPGATVRVHGRVGDAEDDLAGFVTRFTAYVLNKDIGSAWDLYIAPSTAGDGRRHWRQVVALAKEAGRVARSREAVEQRNRHVARRLANRRGPRSKGRN